MAGQRLGVGVVGTGRWAGLAHLPGWTVARPAEEFGICETPKIARPDDVEFRDAVVPAPTTRWVSLPLDYTEG